METRDIPELVMKRKVCGSCGDGMYEFDLDISGDEQGICGSCSVGHPVH